MNAQRFCIVIAVVVFIGLRLMPVSGQEAAKSKFSVKIRDEKTVVVDMEGSGAIDPTKRINFSTQGNFGLQITTMQGQQLHLGHMPMFQINGRALQPGQGGRFEAVQRLGKGKNGKPRDGFSSVWIIDNIHITQVMELYPSKAKKPGDKRLLNTVLVSYAIENKGAAAASVAVRTYMDTYVIDNDGCLFASPVTHPKKLLDGMVLKDKTMPPYLQMLQRPNLDNPGYVSHLTLNIGGKYDKADKLILSRYGAGQNGWDYPVMPSMGDSAIAFYWPAKEIKAGGKRDVAYAYGEGIGVSAENEGRFQMNLGGSFEPGKIFNISAVVADPAVGQTLALELPKGMQRLEGKELQAVGPLMDQQEYSTVLWKCSVLEPGEYKIRIRSSTGITETKIVTITAEK
jgi:hypothetical protein